MASKVGQQQVLDALWKNWNNARLVKSGSTKVGLVTTRFHTFLFIFLAVLTTMTAL